MDIDQEKRMAGDYEIIHALHIGDREIVLGENPSAPEDERYVCAFCREYRHATCQLQLCTSGSGAYPNSRGTACYCTELYSGQRARFERSDILGVIAPEDLPKWAKHYLELRQAEKERNSRDREGH